MGGKNGRAGRHNQECTPRKSLDVAAKTENETRDKIYNALGFRIVHVLQVDDYRDFLAIVLADGDGVPEVSRTHYRDLDTVPHEERATRGFIIDHGAVIRLDGTAPITGVALHHADLRRHEPIHGRPSGETTVDE